MGITVWLVFFNLWASLTTGAATETACGGRWWRRKADGLLLREASSREGWSSGIVILVVGDPDFNLHFSHCYWETFILHCYWEGKQPWWWWWWWWWSVYHLIIWSFDDHLLGILFLISTKDSTITSIRSTNRSQWGGLSLECWWFSMGRIADTSWRIAREVPGIGDWMGGVIHEMIDVFIVIFLCRARLNIWFIIFMIFYL